MNYAEIYPYIRQRLQDSASGVEDYAFDTEISACLRRLLNPYDIVYDDVSEDDKKFVDEAAGLLVASRLIIPYSTGGANGALTSEKAGLMDIARSFDKGDNGGQSEIWKQEAMQAMARTSFAIQYRPAFTSFAVNGPSRARCERY